MANRDDLHGPQLNARFARPTFSPDSARNEVSPVGVLEQIFQLPYAFAWLPALVFFTVVGGLFWLTRSSIEVAAEKTQVTSVKAKASEQRGTFRRQGNTVEVHVAKPEDKKDPEIGSVLDRSMGGMRLALYHEVEVGVVLSIRPTSADNIVPWVDVEVRSCKPSTEMPDHFEVGCQYVKSPPYSIQLLFG